MKRILVSAGGVTAEADLLETPTAAAIWEALPFEGEANTWGQEIYFEIPVTVAEEKASRQEVEIGDLGYWPVGKAFCIFFGPTPVSKGARPRAASPVNVFGRVIGDAKTFHKVREGSQVRVSRAEH